ncbi:MAG: hypothetical protein IPJ14_09420 [Kineosporiaceae bacterium]|nr:hypothetical protein [Kineosporiaceae bacterium]MBK7622865.1 hypothetical protein [Kineosporiaceae bacterium]MBK8078135.1 hypothetical protein [Kineosporiaceae bacterium]
MSIDLRRADPARDDARCRLPVDRPRVRHRLILLPRPDLITDAEQRRSAPACGHHRAVLIGDALAALLTAVGLATVTAREGGLDLAGVGLAMLLPAVWLVLLAGRGGYRVQLGDPHRDSPREVVVAGVVLVVGAAGLAFLVGADLPRLLPPLAGLGLVAGSGVLRWLAQSRLQAERRRGRGLARLLVIGHPEPTTRLIELLDAAPDRGLVVVGVALPFDGYPHTPSFGVPIVMDDAEIDALVSMAAELGVDGVALSSDPDVSGSGSRRLHDVLAERGIDLLAVRETTSASWSPWVREIVGTPLVQVGVRLGHQGLMRRRAT